MTSAVDLTRSVSNAYSSCSYEFEEREDYLDDLDDAAVEDRTGCEIFNSLHELRAEQARLMEEAMDCTGVDLDEAYLMLRKLGWDIAAFNETFFEGAEALRSKVGVREADAETARESEAQLCGICYCDPGVDMLPCERWPLRKAEAAASRHQMYCTDCWREYLRNAVQDGKICLDLRCPMPGCDEAVRPSIFQRLLTGEAFERYQRFAAESLVDDSLGHARWCPGQRCGRAAREPSSGVEVPCPCGTTWCFGCGTDAHQPVACETVKRWEQKNRDEGQDATWIKVNTKLCPKCHNPIEKNGGCMHMTCRKPGGCGYEFCWICMANWSTHKTCNANPVREEEEKKKANTKSELMRYAHYYERYLAHHKAELFAAKEQSRSMEEIGGHLNAVNGYKVTDLRFLGDAVQEIRRSRRFLKWTYAHGYFAKFKPEQRRLFEFHQAQLEGTLERLSDIMENTTWDGYVGADVENRHYGSHLIPQHDVACTRSSSVTTAFQVPSRPFYDIRQQLISLTGVVHEFFGGLREAIMEDALLRAASS